MNEKIIEIQNPDGTKTRYKVLEEMPEGITVTPKDDIDIEKIRHSFDNIQIYMRGTEDRIPKEELKWFTAYRIVKACIENLNGNEKGGVEIASNKIGGIHSHGWKGSDNQTNILPMMKDKKTAEKVISLCEAELKVLFGVK